MCHPQATEIRQTAPNAGATSPRRFRFEACFVSDIESSVGPNEGQPKRKGSPPAWGPIQTGGTHATLSRAREAWVGVGGLGHIPRTQQICDPRAVFLGSKVTIIDAAKG